MKRFLGMKFLQHFIYIYIYVELNIHQRALAKSSPFPNYAGLSYDSPLLTALVRRFDIIINLNSYRTP